MTCPVPFETLVALWARELDDGDAVEEHLFACERCAATVAQLDRLLGGMLELIPPVVSHAQRDHLVQRGLTLQEQTFRPGDRGEAFFAPELDVYVFRLRADLATAQRVDLEIGTTSIRFEFEHVPFDAARGEVLVACQQHFKAFQQPNEPDPVFRVYVYEAGTRREVGSYTIKHVWP